MPATRVPIAPNVQHRQSTVAASFQNRSKVPFVLARSTSTKPTAGKIEQSPTKFEDISYSLPLSNPIETFLNTSLQRLPFKLLRATEYMIHVCARQSERLYQFCLRYEHIGEKLSALTVYIGYLLGLMKL